MVSIALTQAAAAHPAAAASASAPRFSIEAARVGAVLELENERLALMPAVAAWKWQRHEPVLDSARERSVIGAAARLGAPLGFSTAPLERLFALQVRLARDEELRLEGRWRTAGYDFHGRIPNLATEVRPRLDRLTRDLLGGLYLAAPAFSRPGFAGRYAPAVARALTARGWSAASRRELLADLGALRLSALPGSKRIEASGVLRIGTTGDYAPFSAQSHGRLAGVDITLALALARRLGAEPVFVRTSWPTLLADLRSDDFDVAIGGISSTPARAAAVDESIPYLSGGKTILTRCGDAHRFDSLAAVDRPGVRVIVNPGGTNERYDRTHLHRAAIVVDRSNETVFDWLLAGRADVMITDEVEAAWQARRHPGLCRSLPGTLTRAEKVILMPRDPALAGAVNDWLRGEIAAGEPARLLRAALAR